jgi:hypothetical protein
MTKEYNNIEEESFQACEPSSWGGQWTEEKLDAFDRKCEKSREANSEDCRIVYSTT